MCASRPVTILSLDLGTHTGYAYGNLNDGIITADTHTWATPKQITEYHQTRADRRCDPRLTAFFQWLKRYGPLDIVVFEDVEFSCFTGQTQLWASFRAAVWLAFDKTTLVECVPVSTLKKFATGHGGATKEMMTQALCVCDQRFLFKSKGNQFWALDRLTNTRLDDNAVDAVWLYRWAVHHLARDPGLTKFRYRGISIV